MRTRALAGRAIEQHDSPNKGGTMSGHRGVVLHIAQGSYRGTISWQLNPNQRYADGTAVNTCSTWIVGREVGEWAQMVDTNRVAWCQRDGSLTWLSIELAGFAPAPPTAWQVEACAQLLAWAHRTHQIPLAVADHPGERGLGHHAMDREGLGEEWGHEACPGSGVIGAKAQIVARAKAIVSPPKPKPTVEVPVTQPAHQKVELVDATNAALAETWAASVALRDGRPVGKAGNHPGGPHALTTAVAALTASLTEVKTMLAGLAQTPPGTVTIDDEQLEQVIRRVLGSLDGVSPPGA